MLSALVGDTSAGIDLGRLANFKFASSEVELFHRFLTHCLEGRDMNDADKETLAEILNRPVAKTRLGDPLRANALLAKVLWGLMQYTGQGGEEKLTSDSSCGPSEIE
jgi:hypothetical protein